MRFWRFLANESVTVGKLTEGWSEQTRQAAAGRHVLAIEDTCEIKFATTQEDRRGLGKVKKGNAYGVLLHPLLAVDADNGAVLGLAGGTVWTRQGEVTTPHAQRRLAEKESGHWIAGAADAKERLAAARLITIVGDREADFYAHWALTPADNVHLLTQLMHDHALVEGGTVRTVMAHLPVAATATIELRERVNRRPRKARLSLRFTSLTLKRPATTGEAGLPESIRFWKRRSEVRLE